MTGKKQWVLVCRGEWFLEWRTLPPPSAPRTVDRAHVRKEPAQAKAPKAANRAPRSKPNANARLITVRGETKSMSEWSRLTGIDRRTLDRRLSAGRPLPLAFAAPSQRAMADTITYQNRTMTISAWAKEIGIKHRTLRQRLLYGWTVERALTEPLHEEKGKREVRQ